MRLIQFHVYFNHHALPHLYIMLLRIFDNITLNDLFKLSSTTLRDHTLKIYKPQVHLDVRKFFFTVRIIDIWNSLPILLINCETIATFKKHLDCLLNNWGYI